MQRTAVMPGSAEDIIALIDEETSCVVVQSPDVFGLIRNLRSIADAAHAKGALLIAVVTEIVSLGLLEPPGAQGADIVAAEGQSIGNGLNFGGPYVGLFATREKFLRQMPGRLCGETVDVEGRRGYVLTLSTREQHIRREKATSNICTNSGLCCLAFTIHLSLLGEEGPSAGAHRSGSGAALHSPRSAQFGDVEAGGGSSLGGGAPSLPRSEGEAPLEGITVERLPGEGWGPEVSAEARRRMLAGLKRYFAAKRGEGLLSAEGLRCLNHACDLAHDRAAHSLVS
jgi:glycine dehydrogenase subunit 1